MEEFRINNYIVDYETEPYYFKIEEIKRNEQGNLACYYRNGSCWSIAPDRVELTEEILLKCGFIEELYNYFLDIGQRITLVYFDRNECQFSILQDSKEIALKFGAVKYLHQLQNLIHSLTNEELTVNL